MDLRVGLVGALDLGQHGLADLDGVGVGLLADRDPDPALSVDPHDPTQLLIGVADLADLSHGDCGALADGHDGVADLVEVRELGGRPEGDLEAALLDLARREVEVGVPERVEDRVEGEPQGSDPARIELDPDLALVATPHVYLGHTRDAGEAVTDLLVDELGQFDRV